MNREQIYHLYPLGFCGVNQKVNDGHIFRKLSEITELIPHLKSMNVTTLLLGPIFESESHGYDTVDYTRIDRRLGDAKDLKIVVEACHNKGIKVMLDCVFNHIARGHKVFQDIKKNREHSKYVSWLNHVDFAGNNSFKDGFSYDNWDGHDHLVKLNLLNEEVRNYLIQTAVEWVGEFGIDGLRMDAADVMDRSFLRNLSDSLKNKKKGFMLLGEVVHGDYNDWINEGHLDAVTNYEAYKGLYSSLNDKNYHEIGYTLNRQFGPGGIYRGETMVNFVDNHDVNRVASRLENQSHLYPLYIMLYTMPGTPSIYYGSEYGIEGAKVYGSDAPLRPEWSLVKEKADTRIYEMIKKLSDIRLNNNALNYGDYRQVYIDHQVIGYERYTNDERTYVFINSKDEAAEIPVPRLHGHFYDLLNDESIECHGNIRLYKNWARILVRS